MLNVKTIANTLDNLKEFPVAEIYATSLEEAEQYAREFGTFGYVCHIENETFVYIASEDWYRDYMSKGGTWGYRNYATE